LLKVENIEVKVYWNLNYNFHETAWQ
jgi:hypothetical protein